jgi:hypothetical protein
MKIATVNVTEISGDDGLITSLRSFPDNKEGNAAAEKLFLEIIAETTDVDVVEMGPELLDNGYCDVPGGGTVQLVHSTENI